jgi:hypothetical protein
MRSINNNTALNNSGSSLQGYLCTTLAELIEVFGEPTHTDRSPDGKVGTEWVLSIDGVLVTIYDWKTATTPTDEYEWHIGGFHKCAVELAQDCIEHHRTIFAD